MVKSKISELGGSVCVSSAEETYVTGIADGTAKAGWLVGLVIATGVVAGCDTDGVDEFVGILCERYDTDIDTAIASGKTVRIVIPKAGHKYRMFTADLGAAGIGICAGFGADAGVLALVAAAENTHLCRSWIYTDDDTVGEFIWGE